MEEHLIRMDEKGRVLIPAEIRRSLGLRGLVRMRVEGSRVILEAVRNPLEELTSLVVNRGGDVERDIRSLRESAEKALEALTHGDADRA